MTLQTPQGALELAQSCGIGPYQTLGPPGPHPVTGQWMQTVSREESQGRTLKEAVVLRPEGLLGQGVALP